MKTGKLIMSLLILLYSSFLSAQNQSYLGKTDRFTAQDGLPNNNITSLYQDKTGYLWIGTSNGLCKYDGVNFTEVKIPSKKKNHWSQVIETIYETQSDQIWFGSRSGIIFAWNKFYKAWDIKGTVLHTGEYVTCFYQNQKEEVWIGTNFGQLGYYSLNRDSIYWPKNVESEIRSIYIDKHKRLWFCSDELKLLDTDTFEELSLPQDLKAKTSRFWPVDINTFGDILITKEDSCIWYNADNPNASFKEFIWPNKEKIWVSSQGSSGLKSYSLSSDKTNFEINEILKDHSELIWIATNKGLIKIDRKRYRFNNYNTKEGNIKLSNNYIRALTISDNMLWLGFKKGPITSLTYDTNKNDFVHKQIFKTIDYQKETLALPTINSCLVSRSGDVWCGGLEGLFLLNKKSQKFESEALITKSGKPFIPLEAWALAEDNKDRLWIGGKHFGLWLMTKNGISQQIKIRDQEDISIWKIFSDLSGAIWVGTDQGLYRIDEQLNSEFKVSPIKGLEKINIWDIKTDGNGRYFLASTDQGFYIYNHNTSKITSITTDDGLPSNSVCGVEWDIYKNLWLSTVNGLGLLHPESGEISNFYEEDGLASNDFNFSVNDQNTSGRLFFGTKNGLVSFSPEQQLHPDSPSANLVINSFQVNGEEIIDSVKTLENLKLAYNQNNVNFRFCLLEFSRPIKHQYHYKLEPFDRHWKETDGRIPIANYTNLPPADYIFKLKASIDGTHWYNHNGLPFSIRPVFWQHLWFFPSLTLGIILLLAGVLYLRFKSKLNIEQEKNKIAKKMAHLELKALRSQMNPHFIFNAVNSVQHFMLQGDLIAANDYLTRFARLMRFFLEISFNKKVRLTEEIDMLKLYIELETLRFDSSFDYTIEHPTDIEIDLLEIPSMLIQPFLENAIQHGLASKKDKGHLTLAIKLEQEQLIITIEDNGIGREKAKELKNTLNQKQQSRAMQLIDERVELYNTSNEEQIEIKIVDKKDNNTRPLGTQVVVTLIHRNIET